MSRLGVLITQHGIREELESEFKQSERDNKYSFQGVYQRLKTPYLIAVSPITHFI